MLQLLTNRPTVIVSHMTLMLESCTLRLTFSSGVNDACCHAGRKTPCLSVLYMSTQTSLCVYSKCVCRHRCRGTGEEPVFLRN